MQESTKNGPVFVSLVGVAPATDELFEKLKRRVPEIFSALHCEFLDLEFGNRPSPQVLGKDVDIVVARQFKASKVDVPAVLHVFNGTTSNRNRVDKGRRCTIIDQHLSLDQRTDAVIALIRTELIMRSDNAKSAVA